MARLSWQTRKRLGEEARENLRYYRGANPLCVCGHERDSHDFIDFGVEGSCSCEDCECQRYERAASVNERAEGGGKGHVKS
jgi:hypothetical protein